MTEDTVPCPGCAQPMALDQEVCAACRRPRDEMEIEKGRDVVRARAERRRRRPFVIARYALAAAALIFAFRQRSFFVEQASRLRAELRREMDEVEAPPAAPPKTETAAAVIALLGGPPAPRPAPVVVVIPPPSGAAASPKPAPAAAAPKPAPAPRKAVHPSEPDPPTPGAHRLYGVVFDMKSLQPVPHAVVRIVSTGATAVTDEDGHYALDYFSPDANAVDPGTGLLTAILVTVRAGGYRVGQVEDLPESTFLQRPLKKRLDYIEEASPGDLEEIPVHLRYGDSVLPLDVALLPEADRPSK